MPTTKIINVLRNDDFQDVVEAFRATEAQEVIFIFPKGSKFGKNEGYFEVISTEATAAGKHVSIMTADPVIARCASNFGLNLLESPAGKAKARPTGSSTILTANAHLPIATDDDEEELLDADEQDEVEHDAERFQHEDPDKADDEDDEMPLHDITPSITAPQRIDRSVDLPITELADYIYGEAGDSDEAEATLASSRKTAKVKDILHNHGDSIDIKEDRQHPERIFVNVQKRTGKGNVDKDISKMWNQDRPEDDGLSAYKTAAKLGSGFRASNLLRKAPFILIGLAVVVTAGILYTVVGNASITIKPQKQAINLTIKVSASTTATAINTNTNTIPGQKFSQSAEASGTFPATGTKDSAQKATGMITIYNKGTSSQRLVATTRFEAANGLIFRIPDSITVPAATKAGTTLTPGSIQSKVYADRPGPDYNIKPTSFTVPGFKDTPRYGDFSATSTAQMSGGSLGPSKAVTDADFTQAQTALTDQVKQKIKQAVASQASDLTIIDSSALQIAPPISNAKAGDAADNLQMTIKATTNTIAFRESDIKAIIKNYVSKNGNLTILDKDLQIQYQDSSLSADGSVLAFTIHVSGQAIATIDQDKILKDIVGLKEADIQAYFKNIKEIESVRILLSPFWVKSIPRDPTKIKLTIET